MELKKIVIAPDSFKGCLSAMMVADSCIKGISTVFPDAEIVTTPLADGGEGLMDALFYSLKGIWVDCKVHDPLGREIKARYLLSDNGETAVIETAATSGLTLLRPAERNPLLTTTFGLGEMIIDVINRGCRNICVGLGGSATNDGGMGMLYALGFRFFDKDGNLLEGKGEDLEKIHLIDSSGADHRLDKVRFTVACDVDNPFFGERGAAEVFSPQKGADPTTVARLDKGMKHFADMIRQTVGKDVSSVKGSGAAGGLGGAFAVFLNGRLVPGIDLVLDAVGFEHKIKDADLVITGEGSVDRQSLMGKVLSGVLRHTRKSGVPVIAIAGTVKDIDFLNKAGLCCALPIQPGAIDLDTAMNPAIASFNIKMTIMQQMRIIRQF